MSDSDMADSLSISATTKNIIKYLKWDVSWRGCSRFHYRTELRDYNKSGRFVYDFMNRYSDAGRLELKTGISNHFRQTDGYCY